MTDDRDTGEHIFDVLSDRPQGEVQVAAGRLADLTSHIDFLDGEVARYSRLVETERIRHATAVTQLELAADSRFDDQARRFRLQIKTLHDTYRSQLAGQQIQHDEALSALVAAHDRELVSERRRYEEMAADLRTRHQALLESARRQAVDEVTVSRHETAPRRSKELAQANEQIARLQRELDRLVSRAGRSDELAKAHRQENLLLKKRLETLNADFRARLDDSSMQLAAARQRLETERRRSAATLAELLERSAAIAAEADRLRSRLAATEAELAAITANEADNPFEREAELEGAIADLRAEIRRLRS